MKCQYRLRWFSSKGAFLVLLWTLLVFTSTISLFEMVASAAHFPKHDPSLPENWLVAIPILVAFVSAPLSGWLADAKFGNYKVFRAGAVLLFISTVINCLLLILEALVMESNHVLKWLHLCLTGTLFVAGGCACFVTALPLGLDQMPDASSSNITSYIAWFVCSLFVGGFVSDVWSLTKSQCIDKTTQLSYSIVWALFPPLCMSIVLTSSFLFSPKWLIIEPKSPQSLKTIYQVLKFAAKHKAPLNRSALTYWEEDIPSRIDLGKSKYGGPFTTEQVEDVKTVLRLLVLSLPFSVIILFFNVHSIDLTVSGLNSSGLVFCKKHDLPSFVYSFSLYIILGTLTSEFLIYPIAGNKFPGIFKRIGITLLAMTLLWFAWLVVSLTHYFSHSNETTSEWIFHFLSLVANGLLTQILVTASFEFMCAQSPYNMRGLLASFFVPLAIVLTGVGRSAGLILRHKICTETWCKQLIPFSVKTILCVIGFLMFCVVARWYKKRVRDEDYSPQRVVEEVYDRYLTAAAAQSRRYGSIN